MRMVLPLECTACVRGVRRNSDGIRMIMWQQKRKPFICHEYHQQGTSFIARFSITTFPAKCGHRFNRERAGRQ